METKRLFHILCKASRLLRRLVFQRSAAVRAQLYADNPPLLTIPTMHTTLFRSNCVVLQTYAAPLLRVKVLRTVFWRTRYRFTKSRN